MIGIAISIWQELLGGNVDAQLGGPPVVVSGGGADGTMDLSNANDSGMLVLLEDI